MKFECSGASGNAINASGGSVKINYSSIDFGACGASHIVCTDQALVVATGNYSITGGAATHFNAAYGGVIRAAGRTITITGTPAFSYAFAASSAGGLLDVYSMTFSGSATGTRYNISTNAVCIVAGGGATYLPGDAAGSTSTGGQYA
jgi:hypothetical protein